MKILHIINSLDIGGAERLLVDLLPKLAQKHLTADLLVLNGKKTPFYTALKQLSLNKIYSLDLKKRQNPLAAYKITPYIKDYDIVHLHLVPSLYWGFFAKWLSQTPVKLVYTEHSIISENRSNPAVRWADRFIYRKLDAVICISQSIEDSVKNHLKNDQCALKIIPNGIDLSRFRNVKPASRQKYGLAASDFIIVQVSSFRPAKDQDTIIRAIAALSANHKAVFVGDGPRKERCMLLARKLKVDDRILFLGNSDKVPELLSMADAVVLSSNFEGFGLAALEGMASRKPVVASDVPGLSNVVGNAGILFKQGDADALGEILIKLRLEKSYREGIAQRCFERSFAYTIESMVDDYVDLYKSL